MSVSNGCMQRLAYAETDLEVEDFEYRTFLNVDVQRFTRFKDKFVQFDQLWTLNYLLFRFKY